MKVIKGGTLEEQMKSVDVILKQMSGKLQKTVVGIITPFPISGYTDVPVNSVVLRYMFPADGKVTIGFAFVENMPECGVDIYINLHRGDAVDSVSIFTKKQTITVEPDIEVFAGDRLVVSMKVKGQGEVTGIWISFLWVPKIKDAEVKQFLIDDLERISEENAEEFSNLSATEESGS